MLFIVCMMETVFACAAFTPKHIYVCNDIQCAAMHFT